MKMSSEYPQCMFVMPLHPIAGLQMKLYRVVEVITYRFHTTFVLEGVEGEFEEVDFQAVKYFFVDTCPVPGNNIRGTDNEQKFWTTSKVQNCIAWLGEDGRIYFLAQTRNNYYCGQVAWSQWHKEDRRNSVLFCCKFHFIYWFIELLYIEFSHKIFILKFFIQ